MVSQLPARYSGRITSADSTAPAALSYGRDQAPAPAALSYGRDQAPAPAALSYGRDQAPAHAALSYGRDNSEVTTPSACPCQV